MRPWCPLVFMVRGGGLTIRYKDVYNTDREQRIIKSSPMTQEIYLRGNDRKIVTILYMESAMLY